MSLSDVSDLTELSSDDESDIPLFLSSKKKPSIPKTKPEYRLKGVLRPPRTSQYALNMIYGQYTLRVECVGLTQLINNTIIAFSERMVENSIDLDPEYQREVVWLVDFSSSSPRNIYNTHCL
jgi:hypothetical protein